MMIDGYHDNRQKKHLIEAALQDDCLDQMLQTAERRRIQYLIEAALQDSHLDQMLRTTIIMMTVGYHDNLRLS